MSPSDAIVPGAATAVKHCRGRLAMGRCFPLNWHGSVPQSRVKRCFDAQRVEHVGAATTRRHSAVLRQLKQDHPHQHAIA
jgi:hypothetical protein